MTISITLIFAPTLAESAYITPSSGEPSRPLVVRHCHDAANCDEMPATPVLQPMVMRRNRATQNLTQISANVQFLLA